MPTSFYLLLFACLVVVVLASVAGYYLLQVRAMQKRQAQQLAQLQAEGEAQRQRVNRSIQIIAQGLLDDQLTLTEGAIRIKVLLDGLSVEDEVQARYAAFYQLAKATDHIPILEAWKALSTRQKLAFDREREQLESDHREFIIDAAQRIKGEQF